MLKQLKVQNFALIDFADIIFNNTFIVITGETGAGKSILLDALHLAIGEKADTSAIFDKTKKSVIEAIFDISQLQLKDFFETHHLDYQEETILRREISADGKSRAFINDTPVNLSTIKSLGDLLIDIHSQHQNLIINSLSFRYNFVDAIAGCLQDRLEYSKLYKKYQINKKELNELIAQQTTAQKEADYYQFILKELQDANIHEGELQRTEDELNQLQNAENIIQQLSNVIQTLKDADINVTQLIHQAKNCLQNISKYHSKYEELAQRLQSAFVEIKDIANEAENLLSDIDIHPEKIELLNDRLNTINKLLKKHNVKTDTELLNIQAETEQKLLQYQNIDDIIEEKKQHLQKLEKDLLEKAEKLSEKRKSSKEAIEKECIIILNELSIPHAQFVVNIQNNINNQFNEFGKDDIKFLFSANKGIPPSELQKTASGGEISRLMLTIKSMMAKKIHLPTIIFDEIDTGISGTVASKMASIMKKMTEHMQVIAITHLPQIAAKGQQHFYVTKEDFNGKTQTKITELNKEQRIMEIAKMLSDGKPSEAAIQNATELLIK
ncbi:MAG: DNA repair protein RecN [Bacteroidia bacterium]|nr:DNA repair protein RecN [Bacteroidia bacterium]